jgi:hypothetical protein
MVFSYFVFEKDEEDVKRNYKQNTKLKPFKNSNEKSNNNSYWSIIRINIFDWLLTVF